jgi:HSP20 family protein
MDSERPSWVPSIDILITNGDELIIKVDLPSLRRENLALAIQDDRLEISGHRLSDNGVRDYLVTEIPCGHFERVIQVPPAYDLSAARAAYQNGVLRVVVPRKG